MSLLVAVVSGFASGGFLRSIFSFEWEPVAFVFFLSLLFGATAFLKSRRVYTLGAVFFLLLALGMMRATLADTPLPSTFASQLRHRVSYEGVVVADPDVRDATQRVQIRVNSPADEDVSTIVLAVAKLYPIVTVGDRVSVTGTLFKPEPFASEGGRTFQYDKYLQRDGVRFIFNFATIRVLESPAALASLEIRILTGLARSEERRV